MSSPTARALVRLKKLGFTAQVVEKWIPQTKQHKDLFGVIDILAVRVADGRGETLGVQVTSADHQAERLDKAIAEPRLAVWLAAGNRFEVWGWSKRGPKGARKLWQVRRREVRLEPGVTPATYYVREVWEEDLGP